MKNIYLIISSLILVLCAHNIQAATEQRDIIIDNENMELIAPEGESYVWSLNGVTLKENTQNLKVEKSGSYTVEVISKNGLKSTRAVTVSVSANAIRKIVIIGDSTVQTYNSSAYPMAGWGQVLGLYLDNSKITITNKAIGGRSSRTFYEEGRWTEVLGLLNADDYVFIQFGHNDINSANPARYTDTAAFKDYLRIYVNESRSKGAIPVLVSPMVTNLTPARNIFIEGSNDYRGAMLQVAEELDALFIDLNMKSWDYITEVGYFYAAYFLYMGLLPGEYPNYPDGSSDVLTHFQEMGALNMARLIVEGIEELAGEDTNMAYLNDARTTTISLNTEFSDPSTSLITKPGVYPAGAHLTIKTRLNSYNSFVHWEDTLGNIVTTDNLFMIDTEQDSNYYYKAAILLYDCNGDLNGTAYIDSCQRCAGGNTGIPPCLAAFESEDACHYTEGSKIGSILEGSISRTVVNTNYAEDSLLYFFSHSINAPQSGTYDFLLYYRTNTDGEQITVKVNGEDQLSAIDLNINNKFNCLEFQLELEQGDNAVSVESSAIEGGIKFDLLATTSTGLSAGDCAVSTDDNTNPGMKLYPNPFSDAITIISEGYFDYRVYSVTGQLISAGQTTNNCEIGADLKPGMYLLQLHNDRELTTRRILKK